MLTLVDEDRVSSRVLIAVEFECRWGLASVGAVVVAAVVPDAFVTWSAGSDSGTVCNVVRIVADIVSSRAVVNDVSVTDLYVFPLFTNT